MPSGTTNRALAARVALAPPAFHCPSPAAIAMAAMNALSTSACDFAVMAGATASPTVAVYTTLTLTMGLLVLSVAVTVIFADPADMGSSVSIIPLALALRIAGMSDRAEYVGSASPDVVNSLLMSTITAGPSTTKASAPASMNTAFTSACVFPAIGAFAMTSASKLTRADIPVSGSVAVTVISAVPADFGMSDTLSPEIAAMTSPSSDDLAAYAAFLMEAGTSNKSLRATIAAAPPGAHCLLVACSAAFAMAAAAAACTSSSDIAAIACASTVSENVTVAVLETVCVGMKEDASLTTVAVTLTSTIPADIASIVSILLEVVELTIVVSEITMFPRTTLVVVSGHVNRSSALRVIISPAVHRPLAPAPSALAAMIAG